MNAEPRAVPRVLRVADLPRKEIDELAARYGVAVERVPDRAPISGSFWGEPEAGIIGRQLFLRDDTPVHSMLHELCHVVCMSAERRATLDRDAGGDDLEEAAVCYLQVVLADWLPSVGAGRLMQDMDSWGYSFRLGSTAGWFADDADDARDWLVAAGLLSRMGLPVFQLRDN